MLSKFQPTIREVRLLVRNVVKLPANFESRSPLDELIRERARLVLQAAIDAEVDDFLTEHKDHRDDQGRRLVVRNGSLPEREILTGASKLPMRQPRVHVRSLDADRVASRHNYYRRTLRERNRSKS